jgi:hypothetical protein
MRLPGNGGVLCALLVVLWVIGSSLALGQGQITSTPLETLEFTDPLTTLPQVFLRDAFSPVNYGTEVQTNQVVGRAIIPRIPPNTLIAFRPTRSTDFLAGDRSDSRGWYSYRLRRHAIV